MTKTIAVTDTRPTANVVASANAFYAKAEQAWDKAEQYYISAGKEYAECKARLDKLPQRHPDRISWAKFCAEHFTLSRRRVDEIIALADGRKSLTSYREDAKVRMRERSEARLAENSAQLEVLKKERFGDTEEPDDDTPDTGQEPGTRIFGSCSGDFLATKHEQLLHSHFVYMKKADKENPGLRRIAYRDLIRLLSYDQLKVHDLTIKALAKSQRDNQAALREAAEALSNPQPN